MDIEDVRKIASEEMAKAVMNNIDSSLIFSYVKGLEENLDKKDKIINAMAIELSALDTGLSVIREQFRKEYCEFINSDDDCCWKIDKDCKDCIINYFTKIIK